MRKCTVAQRNKTRAQIQKTSKKKRNELEISFNEFYSGQKCVGYKKGLVLPRRPNAFLQCFYKSFRVFSFGGWRHNTLHVILHSLFHFLYHVWKFLTEVVVLRWVSGYVVQCNLQSSPRGLLSESNFFRELTNFINFIDSS